MNELALTSVEATRTHVRRPRPRRASISSVSTVTCTTVPGRAGPAARNAWHTPPVSSDVSVCQYEVPSSRAPRVGTVDRCCSPSGCGPSRRRRPLSSPVRATGSGSAVPARSAGPLRVDDRGPQPQRRPERRARVEVSTSKWCRRPAGALNGISVSTGVLGDAPGCARRASRQHGEREHRHGCRSAAHMKPHGTRSFPAADPLRRSPADPRRGIGVVGIQPRQLDLDQVLVVLDGSTRLRTGAVGGGARTWRCSDGLTASAVTSGSGSPSRNDFSDDTRPVPSVTAARSGASAGSCPPVPAC